MVGFVRIDRPLNDEWGRGLGGARVVTADGTVRTLANDIDSKKLWAMLTANDGEGSRIRFGQAARWISHSTGGMPGSGLTS